MEEDESLVVNDAIQLLLHQIRKDRSVLSQVKKHKQEVQTQKQEERQNSTASAAETTDEDIK